MQWLRRLFDPRAAPHADAEMHCSFCRAERQAVLRLIAGADGACICDRCVDHCVGILEEDAPESDVVTAARWHVVRELESLAFPAARATTRPLVDAAIALAAGDAAVCRRIHDAAVRAGDSEAALRAVRAIPADERSPRDRVNEAIGLESVGAAAEAIAVLDAVDVAMLSDAERAAVPLHRAYFALQRGGVDDAEAARLANDVAAARRELAQLELDPEYRDGLDREATLVDALAARARARSGQSAASVSTARGRSRPARTK